MQKAVFFRKKYPRFIFEKYFFKISGEDLHIFFDFKIEPDVFFGPEIIIKAVDKERLKEIGERVLNNLIFHLGLIELFSYWKATCSPIIEIRAGYLDKKQINWWKNLLINGMGQFFYENKINFSQPNFFKFQNLQGSDTCKLQNLQGSDPCKLQRTGLCRAYRGELKNRILVSVGGGKDSIVTLEILKKMKKNFRCFSLNPTETAQKIMGLAGCKKPIIVKRKLDKKLLELNQAGFLNGHTPFSAYLAFLSAFCALIFNLKYIAFSNERSSNEGNVSYLGRLINHQYSKSFDFEEKFRDYLKKYLAKDIEYFSFLRSLYEVQIAKIFSQCPNYFPVFLSCNEAYKTASGRKKPTGKWCGRCPKCLFVFAILFPFIEEKELFRIFGKNLFEDKNLLPTMLELIGEKKFKPFECVGTKKECLITFYLSYKKYIGDTYGKLPVLLRYFEDEILPKYPNLEKESEKIKKSWNKQNNLPKDFEKILTQLVFNPRG